jgi:hypothetical protein
MDADIRAAEPATIVKAAAIAQSLASLLVGLSGLQLLGTTWVLGPVNYVKYLLIVLGIAGIFMAANQYKARKWAGVGSAVSGAVMAITVVGWVLYTFTSVLSCLMWLSVPLCLLSAVLSVVAVSGVNDTAAARQRLADRGMNLGL